MFSGSILNREFVHRYRLWLDALQYSNNVKQRYPRIAGEFCELLGNREVDRTTNWDIRQFLILKSRKNHRYTSVYETLVVLRNFFDFLSLGGIATGVPIRTVRVKAPRANPPMVASPGTILHLIAAAKEPRQLAAVELLYATGCRARELLAIKAEDIDFASRKIQVMGKFGKSRYVVFGTRAGRAVKAYLRGRRSGYLFRSALRQKGSIYKCYRTDTWVGEVSVYARTGRPERRRMVMRLGPRSEISFARAWSIFKKRIRRLPIARPASPHPLGTHTLRTMLYQLALRAGTRRISPKEFRHCFATHMLDGGADIREIQELLGHSSLTSTQIYTHVGRNRLLGIFDRCHPRGSHYHVQSTSQAN